MVIILDHAFFSQIVPTHFFQIILTVAEHHSNIVPWQLIAQKSGATLKYVGLTKEEVPDVEQLKKLLSAKTKLVAIQHVSNVLGRFAINALGRP